MLTLLILGLVLLFAAGRNVRSWSAAWAAVTDFAGAFRPERSVRFASAILGIILVVAGLVVGTLGQSVNTPNGSRESVYAAVKAFQQSNGLTVDGVVGRNTFNILYAE